MTAYLEFKGFKILGVNFNLIDFEEFENNYHPKPTEGMIDDLKKGKVSLDMGVNIVEGESNSQIILSVVTKDNVDNEVRVVDFSISGKFSVVAEGLNDKERELLLKYNGTAILLPYCRSYLSSITGFDTSNTQLLMPPVNVQEMIDEHNVNID